MVGLLLALGIQGPFVTDSSCLNDTNSIDTTYILRALEENHWESYKYTYIAIIMTVIFLMGTIPMIIFVKEKTGIEIKLKFKNQKR